MRKLRREISEISSEISKIEQDAEMKTLENEGISFQTTEKEVIYHHLMLDLIIQLVESKT